MSLFEQFKINKVLFLWSKLHIYIYHFYNFIIILKFFQNKISELHDVWFSQTNESLDFNHKLWMMYLYLKICRNNILYINDYILNQVRHIFCQIFVFEECSSKYHSSWFEPLFKIYERTNSILSLCKEDQCFNVTVSCRLMGRNYLVLTTILNPFFLS